MAATFTLYATNIAWTNSATNKITLFNGAGSGVVLRIYRMWVVNAQTAAATGVLSTFDIRRVTAASALTTTNFTAVKHDTASSNLPAQVIFGSGGTITQTDILRRISYNSDEPAVGTAAVIEDYWSFWPMANIWDAGYGDNGVGIEPLTAREGQGFTIFAQAYSNAAAADFCFEFTVT